MVSRLTKVRKVRRTGTPHPGRAPRAPVFRFKERLEPLVRETAEAMSRLWD